MFIHVELCNSLCFEYENVCIQQLKALNNEHWSLHKDCHIRLKYNQSIIVKLLLFDLMCG